MNKKNETFSLPEQFGLISEVFLITDEKFNLVYANEYARIRLDLDFQEYQNKPLQNFLTLLNPEILDNIAGIANEETAHYEAAVELNTGAQISINIRVKPFEKEGSRFFSWLLLDYAEEMENRQEMIDFMAQLNEARRKIQKYSHELEIFKEMVDKVHQAFVISSPEGFISFINENARILLGLKEGDNEKDLIGSFSHIGDFPVDEYKEHVRLGRLHSEVIVLNREEEKEHRCYCSVFCVDQQESDDKKISGSLVWNFREQVEEQEIRQQFIDYSAELAALNRELRKNNEEILRLSRVDHLTGTYNRGYCLQIIETLLENRHVYDRESCLFMFDLDNFKKCNDDHGHLFGDEVLKKVTAKAGEVYGDKGLIGRYGGEEFLVIMKESAVDEALALCEKFRSSVSKMELKTPGGGVLSPTLTGGLGRLLGDDTLDSLLERVDSAMYQGKAEGKNRVVRA